MNEEQTDKSEFYIIESRELGKVFAALIIFAALTTLPLCRQHGSMVQSSCKIIADNNTAGKTL